MSYIGNSPVTTAFVTDQFSGNGSAVTFTMSVAPATTSSVLVSVTGVLQDPSTYSVSGTTLTFSSAPPAGTGNISVRYLGIPASGVTTTAYRTVTEFTATAGQTTFSVPSYTAGYIDVYRNGVRLGAADFTATNGTTVVLTSGAASGDLVVTESFYVSSVLNAIPATAGAVNSAYLSPNLSLITPSVPTTLGVGGATPATTGAGITFPATQIQSSDANTLDDYEEGYFTAYFAGNTSGNPAFINGNHGNPYALRYAGYNGRYVKIGKQVSVQAYILMDDASFYYNTGYGASSGIWIAGLPFVEEGLGNLSPGLNGTYPAVTVGYQIAGGPSTWSAGYAPEFIIESGGSVIRAGYQGAGNTMQAIMGAYIVVNGGCIFSATYTTSA